MAARVISSSSALRIPKEHLLVGPHRVDHLGLVVIAGGDLRALVIEDRHGQSHLGPMMHGGASREARSEKMRIDAFTQPVIRPLADRVVKCAGAERPTVPTEPESARRLGVTERWTIVLHI